MYTMEYSHAKVLNSSTIRSFIRKENYVSHTSGLAKDNLQTNVVIIPSAYAVDFYSFCQSNKKACPLVDQTKKGDPFFRNLGNNIDVRYDIPSYNIYKNGLLDEKTLNIEKYWNDDLIGFAIGCSFSFEHELLKNKLSIDHINDDKVVPMYKTNILNNKKGVFGGNLVVSMRIFKKTDKNKIVNISKKYAHAHGEPFHIGEPNQIGIFDILSPSWGDKPRTKRNDEDYYFWACGVTPQDALIKSKLPFCITHTPGHMLITDIYEKNVTSI